METREICEQLITFDPDLSNRLDMAIELARGQIFDLMEDDRFEQYANNGTKCIIDSITTQFENNISTVRVYLENYSARVSFDSFLESYAFLNGLIKNVHKDNDGRNYVEIKYGGSLPDYDSEINAGIVDSMWFKQLQKAEAFLAIYYFIPSSRKLAKNIGIFINKDYGTSALTPSTPDQLLSYRQAFKEDSDKILSKIKGASSKDDTTDEIITTTSYTLPWVSFTN